MPYPLASFEGPAGPEHAFWPSAGAPPPRRVGDADDATRADEALRRIRAGECLRWRGDFHNARQLLAALGRRLGPRPDPRRSPAEAFRRERHRRREARLLLQRLLVPVGPGWRVPLRRAPEVAAALEEALGPPPDGEGLLPLRELLGAVGAHEWRRAGLWVPELEARIHPHHGVFAPVRGEYLGLFAAALAARDLAGRRVLDVGTGTGVLAFLAARRGARVLAVDAEPRAVACARDNAARLGLADRVEVVQGDLFPAGRFDLVLCNPPWLPADAHAPLERAVYDPGGRFLSRFLAGLPDHLAPGGEALLVLSDLAERLGLRAPGELAAAAAASGLRMTAAGAARSTHARARDEEDPLHLARRDEVSTLYCLVPKAPTPGG